MKILYLLTKLDIGGTEAVVRDLSLLAQQQGHVLNLLLFIPRANHLVDAFKENNIKIIYFPYPRFFSLANIFFLKALIKKEAYDLVHAHTEETHFYLSLLHFFICPRVPILMTEHYYRYKNTCFNPFRRLMYKGYQRVICVSQEMKDYFCQHLPAIHKNCLVIPNGIQRPEELRRQRLKSLSQSPITVFCNARLVKQKDLSTCIKALCYTQAKIQLLISGDGKLRQKLSNLISQRQLQDRVILLGWRQDIQSLLQAADIYVQPSRWEGCSIAVLEAMASGLPLVVSAAPGLVEAVGEAALTFPIGEPRSLAACLDRLANQPELRVELSQRAFARAQQFSLEQMWDKHANVYQAVITEYRDRV